MLRRTPTGVDRETPARLQADLSALTARMSQDGALVAWLGSLPPNLWIALGLFLLLVGGTILLERSRAWRRLWVRLDRLAGRGALIRSTLAVVRRAAAPALAVLIWTVGELAAGWSQDHAGVAPALLLIWTAYRFVDEALRRLLVGGSGEASGAGLYSGLRGALLIATWWGALWLLLASAVVPADYLALWRMAGHLALVLWLFVVLLPADRLLSLLPAGDARSLKRARRVLRTLYYPLLFGSLVVALLWVMGYQRLAEVILGRGWAAMGAVLLLVLASRALDAWARKRLEASDPEAAPQAEAALAASRRLVFVITLLLGLGWAVALFGFRPLWLYLLDQPLFSVGKVTPTAGAIWTSLVILSLLWAFSGWIQSMLSYRIYPRLGVGSGEGYALNRLLHYALLVLACVLVLNTIGLSPQSLALVLGGLSVGIGFGLQDIANNIVSGLILLTSRQVKQGDLISVEGTLGRVSEVTLRSTIVTNLDNVDLLVPNSKLLSGTVINWTHNGTLIRNVVDFGVAYGSDPDVVARIAVEVAKQESEVLKEPEPEVWFTGMAENSLDFKLLAWIDLETSRKPDVTSRLLRNLLRKFNEAGINIPFPQRDLHVRSGIPWDELISAIGARSEFDGAARPGGSNGEGSEALPPPSHRAPTQES